ncbi:MAG: S-layer homology domain-containing protein [Oscillospiraceae bacterium]|nr:S-layer homology domain-containing protein [Oscillospiraceae bacterium]
MKLTKRILCLILASILLLSLCPAVSAVDDNNLLHFGKVNSYAPGTFSDIAEGIWWTDNIAAAYELDLMKGNADGTFAPKGSISILETIIIACRLHNTYWGIGESFTQGTPWYQVYLDYAQRYGIVRSGQFFDVKAAATRDQFASVLIRSVGEMALPAVNDVPDGSIPDLPSNADCYRAVYTFYRAGILTGSDDIGSFKPESTINRAEAAAIITRIARPELRKSFSLSIPEGDKALSFSLTSDGSGYLVSGCAAAAKTVTIPAYYKGLPVKGIAPGAFKDCQDLTGINVDKNNAYLYSEGGVVFANAPVKTLVCFPPAYDTANYYYVPDGVKAIGAYAFAGMNSLGSLTLPEGVTTMGDCAFAEVRSQTAVFIPDSLTVIGKTILLDQKSNMPFYTSGWDTVFAKYCDANALTMGVVMPETPKATTVPTAVPSHQTENLCPAAERVEYRDSWPHAFDRKHYNLAEDEQKTDAEIFISLGDIWECEFEATGVYGAGYTKKAAVIRAYDEAGNLVGMQQVNGNFSFCFPGAYDFGIEGGEGTGITFVPVQPVYVTGSGNYAIDADKCYRLPDGNVTNYLIVMYPRASMHVEFPYHLNFAGFAFLDTYDPFIYENSEHYMLLQFSTFEASRVDKMKAYAFCFGGLSVLVDNSEYMCGVSDNIECVADFGTKSYELFKSLKTYMLGNYFPTTQPVSKVSVIADGSYPGSWDSKVTLDEGVTSTFDRLTIIHECVHAIDQSIEATNLAPDCWMEGRAEYISYKLCDKLGIAYFHDHNDFSWDYLTQAQKDDFFSYYYFNSDRQTPYPVGYHFIKYLCETYGENVTAAIMENLANCGYSSWERNETTAAVFKKCVEDATDAGVFQNFVRDVIEG